MHSTTEFWRDPGLPHVEARRACDSRACYRAHSHPTYSIGAVDRGASTFSSAATGRVALQAGAVVFVPAGHVHACNPATHCAWSYHMLHLDAGWLQRLRHSQGGRAPAAEPVRITHDAATHARLRALCALLFSSASADDKNAALVAFVLAEATPAPVAAGARAAAPHADRIAAVLQALEQLPATPTGLQALADRAGLSRFQLIRAFRAHTGMTPHAWVLNRRVNLAREGLRAGAAPADLAYRLGFADQAHFHRVFKAHTATTPGRFRPA